MSLSSPINALDSWDRCQTTEGTFFPDMKCSCGIVYLWTTRSIKPSAGRGRKSKTPLLPFHLWTVDSGKNKNCSASFFQRNQLWINCSRLVLMGYSSTRIFLSSESQEAFRCAILRFLILFWRLQPYWNRCCAGRPCLKEGWEICIISKQRYPGLNYWRI